jgi:hypothetical protein
VIALQYGPLTMARYLAPIGTHNPSQGEAEMPESMAWLWRDDDPSKTEQTFEQDAAEKASQSFAWPLCIANC